MEGMETEAISAGELFDDITGIEELENDETGKKSRNRNVKKKKEHFKKREEEEDPGKPKRKRKKAAKKAKKAQEAADAKKKGQERDFYLPDSIAVQNLAHILGVRIPELKQQMREAGMGELDNDHILTSEEASLLVLDHGLNPITGSKEEAAFDIFSPPKLSEEELAKAPSRPPVVTIMGHVDHGKTTLLDSIRKTSVAASEAGGITQHIGAFSVTMTEKTTGSSSDNHTITFLDTPGHAAFSAMRARGTQTTDIVILVVAADDGVKPQTLEAIHHAQAADVPMIVAVTKCDKPGVNKEKAIQELLRHGLQLEDIGGDIPVVEVSGLTGMGLPDLEETILAVAEMRELRAPCSGPSQAFVVESRVDKGQGPVASVVIRRGTLHVGDVVVAGEAWAKIRTLMRDTGEMVESAGPGTPVMITGWRDVPDVGEEVLSVGEEDKKAEEKAKLAVQNRSARSQARRSIQAIEEINARRKEAREAYLRGGRDGKSRNQTLVQMRKEGLARYGRILDQEKKAAAMEETPEQQAPSIPELPLIVKGDVMGTVEAVVDALGGLPSQEARLRVIHSGVGPITESDVEMAIGAKGAIIGFNVEAADRMVLSHAYSSDVKLVTSGIIYRLLEEAKSLLVALLPPRKVQHVTGEARIAQTFVIHGKGRSTKLVAGCRVTNGTIHKTNRIRLIRNGETLFDGELSELKYIKKDISEAVKGSDCGMAFSGDWADLQVDDVIQSYVVREEARTL
ncbi:MAG: translation initiation factor IF-2 [Piptocephalis tieghemiana]|nr:MAG: translation initiation factor IF-2 [Piptocephalis tieghemiana]